MEFYVYGSITRGELDQNSDVDILCLIDESEDVNGRVPLNFSIYSKGRIKQHYEHGTLFAWHLYRDSRLIFPIEGGFLKKIGSPKEYSSSYEDLGLLNELLRKAIANIQDSQINLIYELGLVYVSVRNIATIASWFLPEGLCCSRYVPYYIKEIGFPLKKEDYEVLIACRHATTRGRKVQLDKVLHVSKYLNLLAQWANSVTKEITNAKQFLKQS